MAADIRINDESGWADCVSGSPAHCRGMNESLAIECPHCGETFSLAFDESEGSAEFVVDCEVCCRPMSVRVRVADGDIESLEVIAD